VFDCGGSLQLLTSNASVALTGLTARGGYVSVPDAGGEPATDDDNAQFGGVGGGAVSVVWAATLVGPFATFTDTAFVTNSVAAVVRGVGTATFYTGGGAVLVAGGGNGSSVTLSRCTFSGNTASVRDLSDNAIAGACGGGACIALGTQSGAPLAGASISVTGVALVDNAVTCGLGCTQGAWWSVCVRCVRCGLRGNCAWSMVCVCEGGLFYFVFHVAELCACVCVCMISWVPAAHGRQGGGGGLFLVIYNGRSGANITVDGVVAINNSAIRA
jgi:hypothetical protein